MELKKKRKNSCQKLGLKKIMPYKISPSPPPPPPPEVNWSIRKEKQVSSSKSGMALVADWKFRTINFLQN